MDPSAAQLAPGHGMGPGPAALPLAGEGAGDEQDQAQELLLPAELTITVMDVEGGEREVAFTLDDVEEVLQKLGVRARGNLALDVFKECWNTILRPTEPRACCGYELLLDEDAPPAHRLIRLELLALLAIPPRSMKFPNATANLSEGGATMMAYLWRQAKSHDTSVKVKVLCTRLSEGYPSEGYPSLTLRSLENTLRAACKKVYETLFGECCTPSKLPPAQTRRMRLGQLPAVAPLPAEQQQQQAGEQQQAAPPGAPSDMLAAQERIAALEVEVEELRAQVASLTSDLLLHMRVGDPIAGHDWGLLTFMGS